MSGLPAPPPQARKHANSSLSLQNFGARRRPTPEPRMLVASLSNLSGTARAIAFPQHVDTTAASHKNESCAPYAPCEAAGGFA